MRVVIRRKTDGLYAQQNWLTNKIIGWTDDIDSARAYSPEGIDLYIVAGGLNSADVDVVAIRDERPRMSKPVSSVI
jgi:hypothetical protein